MHTFSNTCLNIYGKTSICMFLSLKKKFSKFYFVKEKMIYSNYLSLFILIIVLISSSFAQKTNTKCLDSLTHKPQATAEEDLFGEVRILFTRYYLFVII